MFRRQLLLTLTYFLIQFPMLSRDYEIPITVSDGINNKILTIGTDPNGTDGFDNGLDELTPPLPVSGLFGALLEGQPFTLAKDIRDNLNTLKVYVMRYQPETGGIITLQWDSTGLGAIGSFFITDLIDGNQFSLDMTSTDQLDVSANPVLADGLRILVASFELDVAQGWNMIGLPVVVENAFYLNLFPNANPNTFFGFSGAYFMEDSLDKGVGYWLNFPAAETVLFKGFPFDIVTLDLAAGWNMIGGASCDVALSDVSDPGGIINPNTLFGFSGSYFMTDTLKQGVGYWLNTLAAGQITFNCNPTPKHKKPVPKTSQSNTFPRLKFENPAGLRQTLLMSDISLSTEEKARFIVPPLPPAGSFDARFAGGLRIMDSDEAILKIQSTRYPVSITITGLPDETQNRYFLKPVSANAIENRFELLNNQTIKIFDKKSTQYILTKIGTAPESSTPNKFLLHPNYPNPFNPRTTIEYAIPKAAFVEVSIYNSTGVKIRTLLHEQQAAGTHTIKWDGRDNDTRIVSSGWYYYHLEAGELKATGRMLLLR